MAFLPLEHFSFGHLNLQLINSPKLLVSLELNGTAFIQSRHQRVQAGDAS